MQNTSNQETLDFLSKNVYVKSTNIEDAMPVVGYDFNKGLDYEAVFKTYISTGFQATALGQAIQIINEMIKWRLSDEPIEEDEMDYFKDPEVRKNVRCTILMGYTSNMASCGMREYIRYLCQHSMIQAIVTTTGGIEEDIMKCFCPHYIGDFNISGEYLRERGINRIGNLLVPNNNYVTLETWFKPLVAEMHEEQIKQGTIFTPSEIIYRLG
jgi:deoxyhypusine synthase